MKKLWFSLLAGMVAISCDENRHLQTQNPEEMNQMVTEKDKIYVTALIYLREGKEDQFATYRARAGAILERYNARIERIIRPDKLVKGNMPLPDEIHFGVFEGKGSMEAVNNDPDYQAVIREYREPSVKKLIVITSKLSDFEFEREVGDKSKVYAVALLNYRPGKKNAELFGDYHRQACEIMPEFGTHFERFLLPNHIKGDFKRPDEIHRFYFDSLGGLQRMGSDLRMQRLFPLRDESLSDLNFIIGEAI